MNSFWNRSVRALLLVMAILCAGVAPVLAQQGTIAGVLVDSESGETLIGANVVIEGTAIGTATDIDGHYEIKNVVPGTYTLLFSYIGYNPKTVQGVEVKAGDVTRIDLSLSPEAVEVGEVIVEARALRNSDASLLRERQKAAAVSDAISAEAISKSGSSSAADAMEKVTGASVVGGKYVYVRGLGERYSSTHLNGVELPTADPDKKAVQFDLFPANLLDNIVTIKTFTPDKPGNFSGGLVNIGTKNFPDQFNLRFSASTSFNTQTNFGDNFITYGGGNMDWLGMGSDDRALPSILADPNLKIPIETQARNNTEMAVELDRLSKAFNNTMAPIAGTAPTNQSYSISLGNQSPIFGSALGYVFSLSYNRKASYYEDGFTGRYSFSGNTATELAPDLLLADSKSTVEASWGGIANVSYKLSPHHQLGLNTLYSRSGESDTRFQIGTWPKELGLNDTTSLFLNRMLGYTERELYSLQLRGEHHFERLLRSTVEWSASMAQTSQDEPDLRFFASTRRLIGQDTIYTTKASGFRNPSRYFRNLDEGNQNYKLDMTVPLKQWNGLSGNVKLGGAYQFVDRDFRERAFTITPNQIFRGDSESYFAAQNMGIVRTDTLPSGKVRYQFGNIVADASKARNNYTGEQEIAAGYAMIELPLTRRLKAIAGARLETTRLEVISQDETLEAGTLDNVDLLPSANVVYGVTDNMNLRAAFTRTLARPTFREIAPFESFEFINGSFFIGNPNLDRTLITNYDLRWEWFTRPGEIFAVSLFYKDLNDPIERTIIGGTNGQVQFQNVDKATVYGAEFEVRSRFDGIATLLQNISAGVNLSLTHSEINIPETELEVRRAIDPTTPDTRELQGQSPFLINADLGYDDPIRGTTVGLYFNMFGRRLSRVSLGGTPDVFERPSPQLDFTFSQRVLRDWQFKVSAKNLLDSDFKETYRFRDQDFIYQKYTLGRSFSLGITFTP